MSVRIPPLCLSTALVTGLFLAGCGHAPETKPTADAAPPPTLKAEVMTVTPQLWPTTVRTQGSLVADEISTVGSKVAGRVSEVLVDLGDVVRAGEPLVKLDQVQFELLLAQTEAQLQQATSAVGMKQGDTVEKLNRLNSPPVRQEKALWDEAKANLERARQLRTRNVMSEGEVEQISAAERVAEARYSSAINAVNEKIALIGVRTAERDLARQQLQDAVIKAPFDGLIQQRQVAPGTFVQIGHSIVTLVRTNPLRFRGSTPERHSQDLALGQHVTLFIESLEEPLTVEITRISPALDELSRGLLFEARIDNSDHRLRSGLFAEAEIILNPAAKSIVIPPAAISEFAGAEKVWKVTDGHAAEQVVLTGQRRREGVEILEGLEDGDVILVRATDGRAAPIEPIFPSTPPTASVSENDSPAPATDANGPPASITNTTAVKNATPPEQNTAPRTAAGQDAPPKGDPPMPLSE